MKPASSLFFLFFYLTLGYGQNYMVSNAPTNSDANGVYQPNGTNDGVTAYQHATNNFSMYRAAGGLGWVICSDSPPFDDCTQFIDFKSGSSGNNTPPIGSWDTGTMISVATPVELVSFKLKKTNENIILKWETASEIDNKGFEVQHALDAKDWEQLSFIAGGKSSASVQQYDYKHTTVIAGTHYYRLKQIDFDGAYEYSKVISAEIIADEDIDIYPNPVKETIHFTGEEFDKAKVRIVDSQGVVKMERNKIKDQEINIAGLPTGIYFLLCTVNGKLITKSFTKL